MPAVAVMLCAGNPPCPRPAEYELVVSHRLVAVFCMDCAWEIVREMRQGRWPETTALSLIGYRG